MTEIEDFARLVASSSYDALGEAVVEAARQRLFDNLCSAAVGLSIPEGRVLRAWTEVSTTKPPGLSDRIRLLVGSARCTETDDISIACCVTAGAVLCPTATALAAELGASDRDLLSAVVAGYEAMVRLGVAFDGAVALYKGVWPTYVCAPFGTAAVAARLMGLDARQTANALALALARTPRFMGRNFDGETPRWGFMGSAAAEGVLAAQAAAAGLGGDLEVLEIFAKAAGVEIDPQGLGDPNDYGRCILEVDCKIFPTSRQGLSATQAFIELTPLKRPIEEIERVEVFTPAAYRNMVGRTDMPRNRMESLMNVGYQMAIAALEPDRLFDGARQTIRDDATVRDFLAKTTVQDDPELSTLFPATWPGRVRITWRSGEIEERTVMDPPSSARHHFGWAELDAKMRQLLPMCGLELDLSQQLQGRCRDLGRTVQGSSAALMLADTERLGDRRPAT